MWPSFVWVSLVSPNKQTMRTLAILMITLLAFGCQDSEGEVQDTRARYHHEGPWEFDVIGADTTLRVPPAAISIPYNIADLGNSDVWAEVQGVGGPVSDNWLTSSSQTRQSPHRKIKDELGTAYHVARVHSYIFDAGGNLIGYKLIGGGITTPAGNVIAGCNFFAGLDSYMQGLYINPYTGETVMPIAHVVTADGITIPVYPRNKEIYLPAHGGRWWNGIHPLHTWPITGI